VHQHPRRRPVRWIAAAVTALALTATGVFVASAAHAVPLPITDDFEGNPQDRWVADAPANYTTVILGRNDVVHSGQNAARLTALPLAPATAKIFRTITPDANTPRRSTCTARVYLHWQDSGPTSSNLVDVYLRIRQGGRTGQIISTKGYSVFQGEGWVQRSFNPVPWSTRTFTIEIRAYQGTVVVDDLTYQCT
jgi:hypothetical protein